MSSTTKSSVKLALVLGEGDDEEFEVIDLTKIQPLSPNIYLIETKPFFKTDLIKNGAGDEMFTPEQIHVLLLSLLPPGH